MLRSTKTIVGIVSRLSKHCKFSSSDAGPLIRADDLSDKLRAELDTTFVRIKDVSSCNCGQKFEVSNRPAMGDCSSHERNIRTNLLVEIVDSIQRSQGKKGERS